jgi:4-alpha-glucanotransferase
MREHHVHRSYVVEYEAQPTADPPLPPPPATSLAAVNTHDMPPWAAFWAGDDLDTAEELGLLAGEQLVEARAARRAACESIAAMLRRRGLLGEDDGPRAVLEGVLSFLAGSDAAVALVTLEDLWSERRPQNVPGTTHLPNWRRRLARSLEEITTSHDVAATLDRIAELRGERREEVA